MDSRGPEPPAYGRRHAILFAGSNESRQLHTFEFCYRTLVDHFGFDADCVHVLFADGTPRNRRGVVPLWAGGDGTSQLRMSIAGTADRQPLKRVLSELELEPDDLLFIHTAGHGWNNGTEGALVTYDSGHLSATEFGEILSKLPKHRGQIVMMEQCHAGGFHDRVIAASTARHATIASAVPLGETSVATGGGAWNAFACNWIAAQLGFRPDGVTKTSADSNGDNLIQAHEAFGYALAVNATYPADARDNPVHQDSSPAARNLTLGAARLG